MSKVILDTNVPVHASNNPSKCPSEELEMQATCVEYIKKLISDKDSKLVLDMDYEIMNEYQHNVDTKTGMGPAFMRWLYRYIARIAPEDYVKLHKDANNGYTTFPYDEQTKSFDESDKKFVALSNAHSEKPPIIEAADGKWLGYETAFAAYGIKIEFLDRDYAQKKYDQKIVKKGRG